MITIEKAETVDAFLFEQFEQAEDTVQFVIPYSASEHAQKMLDPNLLYLRILAAGSLVGFIILGVDTDGISIEFRRIVVSQKGRGSGQAAIAAMEEFCRAGLNKQRIWLDVFTDNVRGRHIYEKMGYRQFGVTSHVGKPMILYQKNL